MYGENKHLNIGIVNSEVKKNKIILDLKVENNTEYYLGVLKEVDYKKQLAFYDYDFNSKTLKWVNGKTYPSNENWDNYNASADSDGYLDNPVVKWSSDGLFNFSIFNFNFTFCFIC